MEEVNYDGLIDALNSNNEDDITFAANIFLEMTVGEAEDFIHYWGKKNENYSVTLPPNLFEHLKRMQQSRIYRK